MPYTDLKIINACTIEGSCKDYSTDLYLKAFILNSRYWSDRQIPPCLRRVIGGGPLLSDLPNEPS